MVGVLKNKLRSNLPAMSNAFRMRISEAIALEVAPLNRMCEWRGVLAYHSPSD